MALCFVMTLTEMVEIAARIDCWMTSRTQHMKSEMTMRASFLASEYSSTVFVDFSPIIASEDLTFRKITV